MIIFLYGEDNFRSIDKLNQIKKEFFAKNTSNAPSSVFDFREGDFWNEFKRAIKSRGLFAKNSLVIVKNFLTQENDYSKNEVIDFFLNNADDVKSQENIIIFWEEKKPKKNDKMFKWLLDNSKKEEFSKLNDAQLRKWIEHKFLSLDLEIPLNIIEKLIVNKSDNLFFLDNEITKITNFINGDKIGVELDTMIELLINSKAEANIFKTIEFISSGNKKQALEMLHKQLDQGDDPFYILSMYIYQFRNLLKIGEFYFYGKTNHQEIAKIVKLHPFVVQKGMEQLRGFTQLQLRNIYKDLEKVDRNAKKGKQDIKLGLDLMIAKL
ncbi:MAG: DNA polymerase III subunit delta [Parcubacteria group bacterium]|jgi:DNA polymerase-3 subunit delta